MIIHHTQIGSHHTNHNEDAVVVAELTDRHHLLAVMDGCSMGTDSHFASTLVGKTLRKIARHTNQRTFAERKVPSTKALLPEVMEALFKELNVLKAGLDLDHDELLTTLVLAILEENGTQAEIVVVGDGVIACDGEIIEFDQDNKPDYLGYHLRESFSNWWPQQTQRVNCTDFLDLAISSDGILSFRPYSPDSFPPVTEAEITEFLLTNRDDGPPETLYRRQLLHIRNTFGLEHTDDFSVVRYMG